MKRDLDILRTVSPPVVHGTGEFIWLLDGLLYYDGDSDSASLNPALNAAMLLEKFAPMASSAEKKVAYMVCSTSLLLSCITKTCTGLRQEPNGLCARKELHV